MTGIKIADVTRPSGRSNISQKWIVGGNVKAADFDYVKPDTLDAALAELAHTDIDARAIAGGQSLMAMMNFRLAQPQRLVDLGALETLRIVHDNDDAIELGAMTTFAELERLQLVSKHFPLLRTALPYIAHPAIRSRGTIGGSAALADPAAEVPALLLAAEARLNVVSTAGSRKINAQDFFVGPYETLLEPGELLRSISIPKPAAGARFAFYELARRHGDYAIAGVAMAADSIDPITHLRVAFFAVGDCAVRAPRVEAVMNGKAHDDTAALDAAVASLASLELRADLNAGIDTKRHLAEVVFRRAFTDLIQ